MFFCICSHHFQFSLVYPQSLLSFRKNQTFLSYMSYFWCGFRCLMPSWWVTNISAYTGARTRLTNHILLNTATSLFIILISSSILLFVMFPAPETSIFFSLFSSLSLGPCLNPWSLFKRLFFLSFLLGLHTALKNMYSTTSMYISSCPIPMIPGSCFFSWVMVPLRTATRMFCNSHNG